METKNPCKNKKVVKKSKVAMPNLKPIEIYYLQSQYWEVEVTRNIDHSEDSDMSEYMKGLRFSL